MTNGISSLFQRATVCHQRGDLDSAAALYCRIIEEKPDHADSLHLLGIILAEKGELDKALALINKAIAVNPGFLPYYANRGLVYRRLSKTDDAIRDYCHVVAKDPAAFDACISLGDLLVAQERINEGIAYYCQGLKINPRSFRGHFGLGNAYGAREEYSNAVASYNRALSIRGDSVEALSNLGVALAALGRYDEAEEHYCRALRFNPRYVQAAANLGLSLAAQGKTTQAKEVYERAITIDPAYADTYSHMGVLHKEAGQVAAALELFKKALSLKPDCPEFRFNLAISQLLMGDFENGLAGYESRLDLKEHRGTDYHLSEPRWEGEDLTGKKLFVWVEQGLGDTVQHVRFLRLFNKYAGLHIYMECQNELYALLKENLPALYPAAELVERRRPQFRFDCHVPLMSLARLFKIRPDAIPDREGYLRPSLHHPLDNLPAKGSIKEHGLSIGLNWRGSSLHKNDRNRTLDVKSDLGPLLESARAHPELKWYSIQYGGTDEELAPYAGAVQNLSPYIKDLSDTAALIGQMDLVITVDSVVAHLAGALGKAVWVLLPYAPDFRWLLDRTDSPWYRSVRLFRQSRPHDWPSAVGQVVEVLNRECLLSD